MDKIELDMDKLTNNERENSTDFGVIDLKGYVSDVKHNTLDKGLESDSRQRLILSLLKARTKNSAFTIPKINRDEKLPLSWQQQQLWLISQLDDQASRAYHISLVVKFKGTLNAELLNEAYKIIIDRHEILRTNIRVDSFGDPYQYINAEHACSIKEIFLENSLKGDDKVRAYNKLVSELISAPFDLEFSSPIRASLIWFDDNKCSLLIVLHHIVSDAWSLGCFTRELSTQYNAFLQGQKPPLQALPIQYADYAAWQRSYLQDEKIIKEITFWKDRLRNVPVLSLPTDRPRPGVPSYKGARVDFILDAALAQGLKSIGITHGATMFMTLLSIFKVLLNRYTDQSDICIGTPIANRSFDELTPLIGYFVNTLALRSFINPSESFLDTLKQIKEVTLSSFEHQILPFEKVVESVRPERSQSYSPIFQVMMVLQNVGGLDARLTSTEVEYEKPICTTSKLDLTLILEELPNGSVLGAIEYSTDLFDRPTIERFKAHFIELSGAILASPTRPLCEIEFLTVQEKHQLLVEWNDTTAPYPKEKCIHKLFEEQVARVPDALALVFEDQQLTYGELNTKANQLAHYLISHRHVKPDTLVGICVERSMEMVVAILAILKAGGGYVPLDPDYPQSRLQYMLEDASLDTVITQRYLQKKTQIAESCAVYIDDAEFQAELSTISVGNIKPENIGLSSSNLAYVIYTSGSTGKPKGVMIEHANLVNYLTYFKKICTDVDGSFVNTNICFDGTATSFWIPYVLGKYLKLSSTSDFLSFDALSFEMYRSKDSKIFKFTPAHIDALLKKNEKCLYANKVFVGGDVFLTRKYFEISELIEKSEIYNHYGPSEATVGCAVYHIKNKDFTTKSIPIGKPINNTSLLILDRNKNLLPIGAAGELYIGGAGLARGYLNRPELTAQKFIPNPFHDPTNPASSDRLYKTGDLCRYLPDGNIEFLGRIDHQVKIRGFRIELGEIESALMSHELIRNAVVLARENTVGDRQLIGFFTSESAVQSAALKEHLARQLPDYMIPSAFVALNVLPLTPNGKTDRKALETIPVDIGAVAAYVAPRTKLEHQLAEIWSDVLGVKKIDISMEDNFFSLGGHSLLVMKAVISIQKNLGIDISVSDFFRSKNLIEVVKKISLITTAGTTINVEKLSPKDFYKASCNQITRFRFFQKSTTPTANMYSIFKLHSKTDFTRIYKAIEVILDKHEALRTVFSHSKEKGIVQKILPSTKIIDNVFDFRTLTDDQSVKRAINDFLSYDFNHFTGPLFKVFVASVDEEQTNYICLYFDHIISDGISTEILIKEFDSLIKAENTDESEFCSQFQLGDYTSHISQLINPALIKKQKQYLDKTLGKTSKFIDFKRRPEIFNHECYPIYIGFSDAQTKLIFDFCKKNNLTKFSFIGACLASTIHQIYKSGRIVIASRMSDRISEKFTNTIGNFLYPWVFSVEPEAETIEDSAKNIMEQAFEVATLMPIVSSIVSSAINPSGLNKSFSQLVQVFYLHQEYYNDDEKYLLKRFHVDLDKKEEVYYDLFAVSAIQKNIFSVTIFFNKGIFDIIDAEYFVKQFENEIIKCSGFIGD